MPAPTVAELLKEFKGARLEPDAVAECQSVCQTFSLAADELFIRWQTFLINQHGGDISIQPTIDRIREVRGILQQERDRKAAQRRGGHAGQGTKLSRNKERTHYDKNSVESLLQGIASSGHRDAMTTPQSSKRIGLLKGNASTVRNRGMFSPMSPSVFAEPSPSSIRFSQRSNMGRTEEVLHAELPALKLAEDREPLVIHDLQRKAPGGDYASSDESGDEETAADKDGGQDRATQRMRYMFEKMGTRTESINRRIESMAVDVKAEYKIEALANPTYPHQEAVTAVGRILNINSGEGPSTTPLSGETVFLETSRRLGNGRRVPLDVRSTPSFSLFPGQIVAVEGKNLKGTEFAVSQLRRLPSLPHPSVGEREGGVRPFSAAVASGPYTLSDNLEYEPLNDLVAHLVKEQPSAVFLLGPFVSESHPLLKEGQTDLLPEEIFASKIAPHLARLREDLPPQSSVFLVPSTDELCYPFVSFPQPQFSRDFMSRVGIPAGIQPLDNPAQVSVNGVVVGIANIDILFHLVKEEVSRLPALSDRLPRLAWHLVEQRHFYPLSPPPPDCAGILASCDSKLRMHAMPDILIVPSQLRHFVRAHENVVLVNPGHSSKGLAGGTFAKLYVHSADAAESASSMLGQSAKTYPSECISAKIVRI
ncbi:DNA-directed DNA polymerase alpha subunit pol12 [Dipsacomyces acuminosporus]|nr:DNA-directed DNA polymerase alpha subunit pol12 [Dipsacomyces acuminosporus]